MESNFLESAEPGSGDSDGDANSDFVGLGIMGSRMAANLPGRGNVNARGSGRRYFASVFDFLNRDND